MSTKIPVFSTVIDRRPATESADGSDDVLGYLHRIQTDAAQICNDADDIEDARFLAENIVDCCRHILASGHATIANTLPIDCTRAADRFSSASAAANNFTSPSKAAARARLARLSARELEIFTHLAEGRSAAEIAVKLSRSSKTINNHRTRILQKLELKNTAELVRLALRSGLVSV